MLAYLDPSSPLEFDPPPPTFASTARRPITAIELGSGTGFVAASVAEWLRPECDLLIATDLPDVCTLLEMNLRASPTVWVRPLAWGSEEHVRSISDQLGLSRRGSHTRQLTHILCSDLVCLLSIRYAPIYPDLFCNRYTFLRCWRRFCGR